MKHVTILRLLIIVILCPLLLPAQTKIVDIQSVRPYPGRIVFIQWKVEAHADSLYYEVERSNDAVLWTKIARVKADETSHQYCYIDSIPQNGINYYRIGQVANKKLLAGSQVKWVLVGTKDELYMWPNPASTVLHVRTPFFKGSMEIVDASGKLVVKIEITNFIMDVPIERLSNGTYFIHIRSDGKVLTEKFIKV